MNSLKFIDIGNNNIEHIIFKKLESTREPRPHIPYVQTLPYNFKTQWINFGTFRDKLIIRKDRNTDFYELMQNLVSKFFVIGVSNFQSKLVFESGNNNHQHIKFSLDPKARFFLKENNLIQPLSNLPSRGKIKIIFTVHLYLMRDIFYTKFTIKELLYEKNNISNIFDRYIYELFDEIVKEDKIPILPIPNLTVQNIKCTYGKLYGTDNAFLIQFDVSDYFTGTCIIENKSGGSSSMNLINTQSISISLNGKLEKELRFVIKLSNGNPVFEKEFVLEFPNIDPEDNCPICTDSLEDNVCMTYCKHVFHTDCLIEYLKFNNLLENNVIKPFTCPMCRSVNKI